MNARERNCKIQLQNQRVNQELRRNMRKNFQRQRKALDLSIESYRSQVSQQHEHIDLSPDKYQRLSHS